MNCTPTTARVSVASDGSEANSFSFVPSISADGRFVAFVSDASNLVPGDTNDRFDVFVRDTCVGAPLGCTPSTLRASLASDGTQLPQGGTESSISGSGRFVSFAPFDIFLHDTCLGSPVGCVPSTIKVSVASDGAQANAPSSGASINAGGRFVAFTSHASNLVPGDTNGVFDAFVRDTCVGAAPGCAPSTVRASVGVVPPPFSAGDSSANSISGDGRLVAFSEDSTADVLVRDTCLGAATGCTPTTVLVSLGRDGSPGNADSRIGILSADGRFIAFNSAASNLVPGDTNGVPDVFLARTGF